MSEDRSSLSSYKKLFPRITNITVNSTTITHTERCLILALENVTGPWTPPVTGMTSRTGDFLPINKISPPAAAVQLWSFCTLFSRLHPSQTCFSHPLSKGTFFAHKSPSKCETDHVSHSLPLTVWILFLRNTHPTAFTNWCWGWFFVTALSRGDFPSPGARTLFAL